MNKMKVGIIGCGKISGIYLENCHRFDILELFAVADLDQGRAEEQAIAFNVPNVYTVDEILADPQIELIINLTIPAVHARCVSELLRLASMSMWRSHLPSPVSRARLSWILLVKKDYLLAAHRKLSSVPVYRHH